MSFENFWPPGSSIIFPEFSEMYSEVTNLLQMKRKSYYNSFKIYLTDLKKKKKNVILLIFQGLIKRTVNI